jgi:hypothetical protein
MRFLLVLLVMTLIPGCVPFLAFADYRPQMQEGKVTADNCLGHERVAYMVDGVQISSIIVRYKRGQNDITAYRASISVADGERAAFLSPEATIERLQDGKAIDKPITQNIGEITVYESYQFGAPRGSLDALGTMVGQTIIIDHAQGQAKIPRSFSISVALDATDKADYRITLPAMNINGKTVNVPPILFSRITRLQFAVPLNC